MHSNLSRDLARLKVEELRTGATRPERRMALELDRVRKSGRVRWRKR